MFSKISIKIKRIDDRVLMFSICCAWFRKISLFYILLPEIMFFILINVIFGSNWIFLLSAFTALSTNPEHSTSRLGKTLFCMFSKLPITISVDY